MNTLTPNQQKILDYVMPKTQEELLIMQDLLAQLAQCNDDIHLLAGMTPTARYILFDRIRTILTKLQVAFRDFISYRAVASVYIQKGGV